MPELPEVEWGRKLAEGAAVGRRILRLDCADDPIVFEKVSRRRIRAALLGRRVLAVHRRGKHLWFELDARPWPLFHFGMTGAFRVPDEEALPLASSAKTPDRSWPPKFTKIRFGFEGGGELAMTNARRLGRIRLRDDPAAEPPISELGFDPLLDLPSVREFRRALRSRRSPVKAVLLDQSFAAGVGNWIADEVLYQARVDPRRRAADLADDDATRVRSALRSIVRRATSVDADKSRFPRTWLFHRRWGKAEQAKTPAGERIEFITVAGRTTAWVPARQT